MNLQWSVGQVKLATLPGLPENRWRHRWLQLRSLSRWPQESGTRFKISSLHICCSQGVCQLPTINSRSGGGQVTWLLAQPTLRFLVTPLHHVYIYCLYGYANNSTPPPTKKKRSNSYVRYKYQNMNLITSLKPKWRQELVKRRNLAGIKHIKQIMVTWFTLT